MIVSLRESILGVILAGGASRRFGSDKALAPLAGMPLIEHVARRAQPQVGLLAVNGAASALPTLAVIADREKGAGPLSGIVSSLAWAEANGFALLATFACDGPIFPADLVARLSSELGATVNCVMARCGPDKHYTYGVWPTACRPALEKAYAEGLRSLRGAAEALTVAYVDFPPNTFFNINRIEDLTSAEKLLAQTTSF
jgi:molybdopterin-guanine dinucleotide biosynthesis protein A